MRHNRLHRCGGDDGGVTHRYMAFIRNASENTDHLMFGSISRTCSSIYLSLLSLMVSSFVYTVVCIIFVLLR